MILKEIPVGTLCRINSALVHWYNQFGSYEKSLWISQNKEENRYYAVVIEHEHTVTRCLVFGANTSPDNVVWIVNTEGRNNKLQPI